MADNIQDATWKGDVAMLRRLRTDPAFLLADQQLTSFLRTPLHVAAMLGHVEFVEEILNIDSQLAKEVDSQGYTPLHLASTRKNVKMVQKLLDANTDACIAPDQDGRTPLHLAAMRNEVKIMDLLIEKCPDAIHKVLISTGETILHLCVKHDAFMALDKLVKHLVDNTVAPLSSNATKISVNSVDKDGNTILHLAAQKKWMKMLKYLLGSNNLGVHINIENKEGLGALHMLDKKETDDLEFGCYYWSEQ